MNCLFVYNPNSGKGAIIKSLSFIEKRLNEKFGVVDVRATEKKGDLALFAENACGKYDYFVFAGGDGSFNEVVNGLKENNNKPILGYIPTGTVNDIARSAGISRTVKGAVANIVEGVPKKLDDIRINDRYAMYTVCAGGITACSYKAKQSDKKVFGRIAYAMQTVKESFAFKEFPLDFSSGDNKFSGEVVMAMFINSRSVGSFRLDPRSVLDDGILEVLLVRQSKRRYEPVHFRRLRYLFNAVKVFFVGYDRLYRDKNMFLYRGSEFGVRVPSDTVWNFDGEEGLKGNLTIKVLPKNITLICPK